MAVCRAVDLQPLLDGYHKASEAPLRDLALNYAGRLNWSYTSGLHFSSCVGACGVSLYLISKTLCDRPIAERLRYMLVSLVISATVTLLLLFLWNYQFMTAQLLRATVQTDAGRIIQLTYFFDAFSFFIAFLLTLVSCVILLPPPNEQSYDVSLLAAKMSQLQLVLYTGTIVLIFGVLQINALLHWSTTFLHPPVDHVASLDNLITSLITLRGTYYTIFLAVIYLPAALILRGRAFEMACRANTSQECTTDEWLKSRGFNFSIMEQLPRLAVILAPLLSGPAAEILSRLR